MSESGVIVRFAEGKVNRLSGLCSEKSFMLRSDRLFLTALVLSDVVSTGVSFLTAHWVRYASGWFALPQGYPSLNQQVGSLVLLICIWLLGFRWGGLYEPRRRISGIDEFYSVLIGIFFSASIFVSIAFLAKVTWFPRTVLALGLLFNLIFVTISRCLLRGVQATAWEQGYGIRRVVVIGATPEARAIAEVVSGSYVGCRFLGFLSTPLSLPPVEGADPSILGTVADLPDLALTRDVRDVIVAPGVLTTEQTLEVIAQCESLKLKIKLAPSLLDIMVRRGEAEDFDGLPLINVSEAPLHGWLRIAKRMVDVFVSSLVLLVCGPLMVLVALGIKLTSPGPVFFVQERVGGRGKVFRMYKFRTMRADAEEKTGPVWATSDDERKTALGALLRRLSLDELPQLFNVLRGEMSLVGPRPERPYFVDKFQTEVPRYTDRHRVKVGVTGWAQVHGLRGNTSVEERLKYDIYYVENWSILLDLKILVKTAFEVLFHRHAY